MYSTIYKIPKRSASIPYTYEPKLRFSQSYSLLLVSMAHFSLRVVPSLSLVLILIYGNSEQKFLLFKKYISPV